MAGTKGPDTARWRKSLKSYLSPDRSLQLDSVKLESLVIADQHAAVNVFPGLYTPPVKSWKSGVPKDTRVFKVRLVTGTKS